MSTKLVPIILSRGKMISGFLIFILGALIIFPDFLQISRAREHIDRTKPSRIINIQSQNHNSYLPLIFSPTIFASEGDWPQYQHDAARSGYNPSSPPSYNFQESWSRRFADDAISPVAQPIIIGNTVLIGTEKGKMLALNLSNGAVSWEIQLNGGVTHASAATKSTVFVGTLSGNVYALDINTGKEVWRYQTTGSFGSAALLVEEENTVYLANRHGKIHALDVNTGSEIWVTDLGSFIFQSPTYGDKKIYIGAEDMKMYALDAETGKVAWTSKQLYGMSFHDYSPIFAEGKVIVNVMPDTYSFSMEDLDLMKEANVDKSNSKDLSEAQDATIQWLQLHPESQTFYVFEAETGQMPYTPGVLYTVVNNGAQPPPVYAHGNVYTAFHVTSPMWLRGFWGYPDYGGLGSMHLASGRIVERLSGTARSIGTPGEFTVDETNNFSGAGNMLVGARCQAKPGCTLIDNSGGNCSVNQNTLYPFTSDICVAGSPPVYANGYIVYHAFNVLMAYQASK
jgi:outer membrane protein assembly factor BamB